MEGDIFKTIVQLDDEYSTDVNKEATKKNDDKKVTKKTQKQYEQILNFMEV